jgi:hypothetical protein
MKGARGKGNGMSRVQTFTPVTDNVAYVLNCQAWLKQGTTLHYRRDRSELVDPCPQPKSDIPVGGCSPCRIYIDVACNYSQEMPLRLLVGYVCRTITHVHSIS